MRGRLNIAVLGIGQELRGDDALGLEIANRLAARFPGRQDRYIVATGPLPESFTGPLRRFMPQRVILVDAAIMGLPPGAWRRLDWRDTSNYSASTHSMPLSMLSAYLESELGCTVELIGVQPGGNELGADLTTPVASAVDEIVTLLAAEIS